MEHHPGLTDLIEFQEVEHITGQPLGECLGIPAAPVRYRQLWPTPQTHVPGLFPPV